MPGLGFAEMKTTQHLPQKTAQTSGERVDLKACTLILPLFMRSKSVGIHTVETKYGRLVSVDVRFLGYTFKAAPRLLKVWLKSNPMVGGWGWKLTHVPS